MAISKDDRERGLRIRHARNIVAKAFGRTVSQTEMAALVSADLKKRYKSGTSSSEIHQDSWSRWESGRTRPSIEEYEAIASVSGEDICWLVFKIPSAREMPKYFASESEVTPAKRATPRYADKPAPKTSRPSHTHRRAERG